MTDLVTLCWAVKAQGQGHSLERVARCEQRRRSSGMQALSIRRSEYSTVQYSTAGCRRCLSGDLNTVQYSTVQYIQRDADAVYPEI